MMFNRENNVFIAVFFSIFFVASIFLSLFHFGMLMNGESHMANCPFMSGETDCPMTLSEHMSAWQNAFVAILPEVSAVFVAALLLLIIWREDFSRSLYSNRYFEKILSREHVPSGSLQELFSQGILHPKLF